MFYFQNRYFWGFLKRGIWGGFFEKKIREKIFPISTFFFGKSYFFFQKFFPKKIPSLDFENLQFSHHNSVIFQKS